MLVQRLSNFGTNHLAPSFDTTTGEPAGEYVRSEDYDSLLSYAELLVGLLNGARAFVDDEAYAAKIDAALSSHYLQGASIREDEGEAHDASPSPKSGDIAGPAACREISAGLTTQPPDHFVHETGDKCQGTPPCPRCLVVQTITNVDGLRIDTETVRKCVHQSCTKSPTPRTDEAVARGMRDPDNWASLARELEARTEFQVNQLPPDVAAAMQAIDKTYGRSIKGGERAGYVMGSVPVHHLGTVLDYVRSLLVACTKQEGE